MWDLAFPTAVVNFLPEGIFDHSPMIISTVDMPQGLKPFKFYNHWVFHEHFEDTVKQDWNQNFMGTRMFKVVQKLKQLKPLLKEMDGRSECSLAAAFKEAKKSLLHAQEAMHHSPHDPILAQQENWQLKNS